MVDKTVTRLNVNKLKSGFSKANYPFGGADEPLYSDAKTMPIYVIGEGYATGIEDIHVISDEDESGKQGIFDLQGRQLNAEPTHGIYIKNGKKYVK